MSEITIGQLVETVKTYGWPTFIAFALWKGWLIPKFHFSDVIEQRDTHARTSRDLATTLERLTSAQCK